MIVAIGSDHAGYEMRDQIINYLKVKNIHSILVEVPHSHDGVDYPEIAHKLVKLILTNDAKIGILICGTGIGMSIVSNRYKGIRAALCTNELQAQLAREHNDSNILCLGARIIGIELAKAIVDKFIFSNPPIELRHLRRIQKIDQP
ncbi:MAG: ribose 5-phosphate isomerase B [bacterium]|nr:ribose 5-phosphate isomerase B [bacterium]